MSKTLSRPRPTDAGTVAVDPDGRIPGAAPPWVGPGAAAAALLIGIAFPFVFSNPTTTTIAVFTLIFVACASAWNLFAGFSGYIALGNAVFYGVGAYTVANITTHLGMKGSNLVFLLLPLAGVAGALIAVPVGWLALRTRRHTFVVITIAIFFIFQLLAYNLTGITNGSAGMSLPIPQAWGPVSYNDHFYFVALILAAVAVAASWLVRRSRFGLDLLAIRDDEDRARGLGVATSRVKLATFMLTGLLTGMAGGLYAYFVGSIYPPFVFDALFDVSIALMAYLGGVGTVAGPVIGALILEPLQQYLTIQFSGNGTYLIAYGVLFLLVMQFLPQGILPTIARAIRRRALGRDPGAPATTAPSRVAARAAAPEA